MIMMVRERRPNPSERALVRECWQSGYNEKVECPRVMLRRVAGRHFQDHD